MEYLKMVLDFHRTFGHPAEVVPAIPSKDRCKLRVALLREELEELEQAIEDNDLVEVADALADLQYVLLGAVLEFGLTLKFDEIFHEVHRSNMSKMWSEEDLRNSRVIHYRMEATDGGWICYNEQGKVVKPPSYSPANIAAILNDFI